MGSNLPHSNINEWAKWYHSNCKNVLPHTKMAGRDKNDRTNSRTICQQNRIAFSRPTQFDTGPTCYVSFHYSIYSNIDVADAQPAHVTLQKFGYCVIALTEGQYCIGRLSINVLGFDFIGLLIITAWQLPQNPQHHLLRRHRFYDAKHMTLYC